MRYSINKDRLVEEIMIVRETGLVNMCYCGEVYEVAQQLELTTLIKFLKSSNDNRVSYFNFIVTGDAQRLRL